MVNTRILIVEDKKSIAEDVASRLKELEYTVCAVVPTGAQAVEKAAEMSPDLVFINIELEGKINGIEAAKRIRNSLDIPTIYLAHYRSGFFLRKENLLKRAEITNLHDYIPQPYGKRRLYLTIESVLSKHRREMEEELNQTIGELRHQTQLTNTIFNSISDGVIAADASGTFTIFNPSAERILGIGPIDTTPDKWSEDYGCFFPDRVTPFPADELPLARALKGEASDEVEMFVRNPEVPEGIFISVNGRPLQGEEGTEKGGVIVFRDVTHRVIAEEALAQAFAPGRLEIVETILHNIGNAINSVTVGIDVLQKNLVGNELMHHFFAFADVIKAHQEDWVDYIKNDPQGQQVLPIIIALATDFTDQDKEVVETLERVSERVKHINDIIRTQKSSNQPSTPWKNINLQQAILSAAKLQQESIDKRGIQVHVNCENAPQEIRVQEIQFHQMLVNLVKNSIEAIDELIQSDGLNETPRIEVKAYIAGDFLCLDITDNGIGIAQKNLKLIFTAGYTTKESGTGLGLHSSANFVIGSGGKIYPLSKGVGKGTTMRIMLRCSAVIP